MNRLGLRDMSKADPLSHVTVPREGPVRCSSPRHRAAGGTSEVLQRGSPGQLICATLVLHHFRSLSANARERQTPSHRSYHPRGRRRVTICCDCGTIREFGFRGLLKPKNYHMDLRNCQRIRIPIALPVTARIQSAYWLTTPVKTRLRLRQEYPQHWKSEPGCRFSGKLLPLYPRLRT